MLTLIHVVVFPVIAFARVILEIIFVTIKEYIVQDVPDHDEYSPDDGPEYLGNCTDDVAYVHGWLEVVLRFVLLVVVFLFSYPIFLVTHLAWDFPLAIDSVD